MTLDPLLSAPQPIPVHAIAALVAMVLGGLQLWGPKGTAIIGRWDISGSD